MMQTDLLIIGAGPGGYRAAEYAAKQGLKVVIAEEGEVGGTCLNVGCIPTKTYVHAATFAEARERMATVIPQLRSGVEGILSHPNITLLRGRASFVSSSECSICGDVVAAKNIIIATGSETKWLPIKGVDDPRVVDSTGLLQLETLPKKLCIIGAGVIGMEFASVFNRFGSELEKQGVTFKMKTAVENVADLDADVILMATGRKPRTAGLGLETLGVTLEKNGAIPVDDHFQLPLLLERAGGEAGLYAIGDANGRQMLAHAAEMQAVHAVNHILGKTDAIRFDIMPAAIFTEPEAACVGPTEDQLKEQGIPYECHKAFWRANGKALAMGETEGMLKLFITPPSQGGDGGESRILGCHAFGAHAADIVQEVSVLMCRDTTVAQLRDMVHIHPTLGEILVSAVL